GAQLLQIVTVTKALAFRGENDAADRALGGDSRQFVLQRCDHGARQGVVALATIERQAADSVLGMGQDIRYRGSVERCIHCLTSKSFGSKRHSRPDGAAKGAPQQPFRPGAEPTSLSGAANAPLQVLTLCFLSMVVLFTAETPIL